MGNIYSKYQNFHPGTHKNLIFFVLLIILTLPELKLSNFELLKITNLKDFFSDVRKGGISKELFRFSKALKICTVPESQIKLSKIEGMIRQRVIK